MCRRVTSDSLAQSEPSKVTMVLYSSTECLYATGNGTFRQVVRMPNSVCRNVSYGPLSSVEFITSMAFLGGQEEDFPDHEIYFAEISKIIPKEQIGFHPIIYKLLISPYENGPMMICLSQLLHPKSRGTVRLQSTNPYDPPLIDPNYFDDPADIESIVRGLKTCRKIGLSEPMRELGVKPFATVLPGFTNLIPDLDLYFKLLARLFVVTLSHQVGTAKMGDPRDPTTVVDPLLRVKGIQGLRVVDASVMPIVPSGNTNIPTIMIAEKASDIIKESMSCASHKFPNNYDVPDFTDIYNPYEY
ncbi:Glucose dehydrogenase [FAD, quinone] [Araneus ventricosus]|uniref:Glucose dehydrogenase [FAD, quinone] n=1 Tax=Araneus ventricosus TaxID=182803 RepID=A0A4Y2KH23_ARAVE|nr:Glucose dehydrogenase [FAD, quinone] [Araneus ventricosus]